MSAVLKYVREKVGEEQISEHCREEGCSVRIEAKLKPYILINRDRSVPRSPRQKSRCDYILLSKRRTASKSKQNLCWVVPIELKSGTLETEEAVKVVEQLQAGSEYIADKLPADIVADANVRFRPIAAHGGMLKRRVGNLLRKSRVRFRGKTHSIVLIKCGSRLTVKTLQAF